MSVVQEAGVGLIATLSTEAWYNIGLAVVLVSLVIAGVVAYRIWREVNEDVEPATMEELLASFEQARYAGDLDDEEYARVRRQIEKPAPPPPASKPPQRDDQGSTLP
jgi:uncharacterized membrane protein